MKTSFFDGIEQTQIRIGEALVNSPVFFRDLSFDAYVFSCDARSAVARLPSGNYSPIRLPFGRCLSALLCLEHRDSDLGPYNEAALCVPLSAFGSHLLPDWLTVLREAIDGKLHAHILHMPVNSELALRGGVDYYGFPKFMAGVAFRHMQNVRACELTDRENKFLSLRISPERERGISLGARNITFCSYPVKAGKPLLGRIDMQFDDLHANFFPRLEHLEIGNSEMAEAASLLLQHPIAHISSRTARGILRLPVNSQPSAVLPTAGCEARSRLEAIRGS